MHSAISGTAHASTGLGIGGFVPKPVRVAFNELLDGPDYTWAGPSEMCPCGNDTLAIAVRFHDGEIGMYFVDGRCLSCGSYLTVPAGGDDEPNICA